MRWGSRHTANIATSQLGAEYEYHLASINYRSSPAGKTVAGVVTAWKNGTIKHMPFQWRE